MKHIAIGLSLLLCIFLTGCGKGTDVVGKWKGSVDTSSVDPNSPGAALAKSMMANLSLELKADKNFVLTMGVPLEGTYDVAGTTVTLTTKKVMGMSAEEISKANPKAAQDMKPLVLTLSPDGKTLTGGDPSGKSPLVFTKE